MAKLLAKNEEKPCSTCLQPIFRLISGTHSTTIVNETLIAISNVRRNRYRILKTDPNCDVKFDLQSFVTFYLEKWVKKKHADQLFKSQFFTCRKCNVFTRIIDVIFSSTLFRNKRFMLNLMLYRNASKFAIPILYIQKPKLAFTDFHFMRLYFFPNEWPGLFWHRSGNSLGKK